MKEENEKISNLIHLSQKILEDTQGFYQKKHILDFFKKTQDDNKEDINLRLVLIDSFYSTNMKKRYFAIDDLTEIIIQLDKKEIIKSPKKFFEKNYDLLTKSVGIGKNLNAKGHGFSLLSKYLYFLTDFQFPIYDSLVFKELTIQDSLKKYPQKPSVDYFKKLEDWKIALNCSYDDLDLYFWICGKIRNKSFSLLAKDKTEFIEIQEKIGSKYELIKEFKRRLKNE